MNDAAHPPLSGRKIAGGLTVPQFIGVACLFWAFVTRANIVYAYGMRLALGAANADTHFASWDARVLQHLFLLPVFLAAVWTSLRIQWRPPWLAVPLQCGLGIAFAGIAYPALILGIRIAGSSDFDQHMQQHALHGLFTQSFLSLWLASFVSFLPAYGFGVAMITGFSLYSRVRDAQLQVAALEREWSAARLAALRMQLSPHSLFNLLHTIRGNIEWDPKAAQSMVVQLADLLRRLLRAGDRDFSLLTDELHLASLYLRLQQKRFSDRLSLNLPDPGGIPAVWVPSLILQPLVENAVLHGLEGHRGAVNIRIGIRETSDSLLLEIVNGMSTDIAPGESGIGLNNVRERLTVQFPAQARLSTFVENGHWRAEISMPIIRNAPSLTAKVA